jgi:hypothetical protein
MTELASSKEQPRKTMVRVVDEEWQWRFLLIFISTWTVIGFFLTGLLMVIAVKVGWWYIFCGFIGCKCMDFLCFRYLKFTYCIFFILAMVYYFYVLYWTLLVGIINAICSLEAFIYMVISLYELFYLDLSLSLFLWPCSGKLFFLFLFVWSIATSLPTFIM